MQTKILIAAGVAAGLALASPLAAEELQPFMSKGLQWLADAQQESGGWGAGSHARQDLRDPFAIKTDPGTTAFTAMAFIRAGHTTTDGEYAEVVRKATEHLLAVVEGAKDEGPRITDQTGTQIQSKLGQFIDTAMAAQFFGRVVTKLDPESELHGRVDAALDKCIAKILSAQKKDGSWNTGGWAPVLQSAMCNSALERASVVGKQIDDKTILRYREFQRGQMSAGGKVQKDGSGVELYAASANQAATAIEAKQAEDLIEKAKVEGRIEVDAEISEETLRSAGADSAAARGLAQSFEQNEIAAARLDDERLLSGFGNNGGEEFLSYLLTSESLVTSGSEKWDDWNAKMHTRLAKIQNEDGSWSGHHCISSPVFCTAAVLQCLTTDRDAAELVAAADVASAGDASKDEAPAEKD